MNRWTWFFRLQGSVGRGPYAAAGFGLMGLKYGVEALFLWNAAGTLWTPVDFLIPLYGMREAKLGALSGSWLLILALWSVPFVWIAAALSLRRARNAGIPPEASLLVFAPVLGYFMMGWLAFAPAAEVALEPEPTRATSGTRSALAIALPAAGTVVLVALATEGLGGYGLVLFLGVPLVAGFGTGWIANSGGDIGLGRTVLTAIGGLAFAGALLLLLALEGLVCLVMVAGLCLPIALFGAVLGRAAARQEWRRGTALPAVGLVPLLFLDAHFAAPVEFEVATAIEVDAPPERVWPNVIGFAELPAPDHWLFRTGIAYPLRARIEGEGVGAVRHCEFSTGAFVEPITLWEPPYRLAFDVIESPPSMQEWSFYAKVEPPHLQSAFRSVRGEFRLIPLPGGRTRLEGSTWYVLEMAPVAYWRVLTDSIVHRIHTRVLEHVAKLSE